MSTDTLENLTAQADKLREQIREAESKAAAIEAEALAAEAAAEDEFQRERIATFSDRNRGRLAAAMEAFKAAVLDPAANPFPAWAEVLTVRRQLEHDHRVAGDYRRRGYLAAGGDSTKSTPGDSFANPFSPDRDPDVFETISAILTEQANAAARAYAESVSDDLEASKSKARAAVTEKRAS